MAQQVSKPRRTKHLIDLQIEKMFELLSQGLTDSELQKALQMNNRTFYWYKRKMYEHYGNIAHSKTDDTIYMHQELLYKRLSHIYKIIEDKLTTDKHKMNGMEISVLAERAEEIGINILKLESEGLRLTNRNINRKIKDSVTRYLTDDSSSSNNNNNDSNNMNVTYSSLSKEEQKT